MAYLPVRSGSCQMPRWPGPDDRAELELGARRVERRQADEALDDRHLALVDDQHRHQLHPHQERVEQVRAVQQRVVLQADAPAGVEERLEVLVVVVQVVLRAEQDVDELGVGGRRVGLQRGDVVEAAEPAGDVALVERRALERGDQADDVVGALGRDDHHLQLLGRQARTTGASSAAVAPRAASSGATGTPNTSREVITMNATGWIGTQRARRQHRPLHALLAAVRGRRRGRRSRRSPAGSAALLAPIGRGAPTWAMTTPISPAGTCTHGYRSTEKTGQSLNRRPGHEQLGLVAGLAAEGDGVVVVQLARSPASW